MAVALSKISMYSWSRSASVRLTAAAAAALKAVRLLSTDSTIVDADDGGRMVVVVWAASLRRWYRS